MKSFVYLLCATAVWAGEARYARLGEFQGDVQVQMGAADAWMAAERNLPLVEGAWLSTGQESRLEIELDDGSAWRLGPQSSGGIADYTQLSTGQRITLLSLDYGIEYFSGAGDEYDSQVLAVPGAEITVHQAARVRIEASPDGTRISVLAGTVRLSSPAVELDLAEGHTMLLDPAKPGRFVLDHNVAAEGLDVWNKERERARGGAIAAFHVAQHYGLADLDSGGEWIHTDEFGAVWKPRADAAWVPFQNGRWRWYAPLGFTWVSGDAWGWLPYHYGRWAHRGELGWLWVPGGSQVFKPGEVYWLRGAKFVGWGPLAPDEAYPPQTASAPDQYFDAYTTYAAFTAGATAIDPAGFAARPKEPLKAAAFAAALPSPPFDAARLDATRPVLAAGGARVEPVVPGDAYRGTAEEAAAQPPAPPAPAPVTPEPALADNAAPAPDDSGALAVPYPLLVYIQRDRHGTRARATAHAATSATLSQPSKAPASSQPASPAPPSRRGPARAPAPARRWPPGEYTLYQRALADESDTSQLLADLERWKQQFPSSEHEGDRALLYVQAYNRTAPPEFEKLVDSVTPLLQREPNSWFDDNETGRGQALAILYLVTASAPHIPEADTRKLAICFAAATKLLEYLPEFFDDEAQSHDTSQKLWKDARTEMENAAHATLTLVSAPPASHR